MGDKVEVFSEKKGFWFSGEVIELNPEGTKVCVTYKDSEEWAFSEEQLPSKTLRKLELVVANRTMQNERFHSFESEEPQSLEVLESPPVSTAALNTG